MSKVDEKIADIKTRLIGSTGHKVLLVEGEDDVLAFRILLDRRVSDWEKQWLLVPAGKKDMVIAILAREPAWQGVVDRDEWADAEAASQQAELPNLFLLPRFCLESYLTEPGELWEAFPEKQRAKLANGYETLALALHAPLSNWVRHAAIWHAVNPLWRQMRSLGFTNTLLSPQDIPDDNALQSKLAQWQGVVDATTVMADFQRTLATIQGLAPHNQLTRWIHAKHFYSQVVHSTLDGLLGQRSEKNRRADLFRHIPLPNDLEPLWLKMELT